MKIVVIGGSGLIGKKLCKLLRDRGHEVLSASPSSGVNALTGEGLADALRGAHGVVDVSNSPSFEDNAVLAFFETSSRNLMAAEEVAGVAHHLALSVVGADQLADSGYMRAKVAQENLIRSSNIPYTIARATQFFEFLGAIADSVAADGEVHLPTGKMQPMAADDVAAALAELATRPPAGGTVELAGPEPMPMYEAVGRVLAAKGDSRRIVPDAAAPYFGARLAEKSLVPGLGNPQIGPTSLTQWIALSV